MSIGAHTKFWGKVVAILAVLALFFVMSAAAPSAHAQARHKVNPAFDTSKCTFIRNVNYSQTCVQRILSFPNPGGCGSNSSQYHSFTDGDKYPAEWTYTDEGNHCMTITFNLSFSFSSCDVSLYVPRGNAEATFTYYWNNGANSGSLNENNYYGWVDLFTIYSRTSLYFYDYQTQGGGAQLGWGADAFDGVRVFCA